MKKQITLFLIAITVSFGACQSNTTKKTTELTTSDAGVYYFHGDRKCKTCKVVGEKAKEVAEKLQVNFFDINFDEEGNEEVARQFQASSSSLFVKSAKSGKIEDLTNFAFRNAVSDTPAYIKKLQTVLKSEFQ